MSIQSEIERIGNNVNNTLNAIAEAGGNVPDGANSDYMATGVLTVPKVPSGGDAGQILAKKSENDYETEWVDPPTYSLPTASADVLGGVKVGTGLAISDDGVLSLSLADGDEVSY